MARKPTYEELEQKVKALERKAFGQLSVVEEPDSPSAMMADILESLSDGFFSLDDNLIVLYFNKAAEELLGRKRNDVLGQNLFEAFPEAKGSIFDEKYTQSAREKQFASFETFFGIEPYVNWYDVRVYPRENGISVFFQVITERKRLEEEIQRSKVLLESSIESPKDMIILSLDREYQYLYFNATHAESMADVFGTQPQIGGCIFDYMKGAGDIERVKGHYDRALAGEGHTAIEEYGDGQKRYFYEIQYNPIVTEEHGIVGITSFAQNITGRKRAEEKLLREKETAQHYLDLAGTIFVAIDREGKVTLINRKGCEVLGYSEEEVVGKNWFDNFIPAWLKRELLPVSRQLLDNDVESAEYHENPVLTRSGEERMIMWHNAVLKDDEGNVTGHLSSGEDITERKRAESALRESESLLREAQRNAKIGHWELHFPSGRLVWSEELYQIFGLDPETDDPSFATIYDLIHEEDWPLLEAAVQELSTQGRPLDIEFRITLSSGETRWIHTKASAALNESTGSFRRFGTSQDITDRKKAQEEKEQLLKQLERSQKMEAIGTLAGGIAHDFNNILGIILGNTELAIDDMPDWNPAKECLREIRSASLRARGVIRQILSFSRHTLFERRPIKLSSVVDETLTLMRASIPTSIDIREDLAAQDDVVSADQAQISQVMMNLCTNAYQAMTDGGTLGISLDNVAIDEGTTRHTASGLVPGSYIQLSISDTGHGIAPENIDKVFDPYFTTKELGEGTGIGLAVVQGIVTNHNGAITVDSEPGRGTTFRVYLPLADETLVQEHEESEHLPTGSERLILVDDEKSLVRAYSATISSLGYDVVPCTSSRQALEIFLKEPDKIDLIITDMTMPEMTGEVLTQELRKIRPDVPIIICTGHSERIAEESAKALGIAGYAVKPIVKQDIAVAIRKALDG